MLNARDLVKEFRVARREPGLAGALRGLLRPRETTLRAVDGVSLALSGSEIVGLLGPNGAGKSTTLKMLTGVLDPTSGRVDFEGRSPRADRRWFTRRIGAVFGQRTQLWWELPLRDSLAAAKALYEIPDATFARTRAALVAELEIGSFLHVPVRQLSLGQKMRAELCAAMLHRPRLLFLDEPTLGLDLEARAAFHRVLRTASRGWGTGVLLTTHDVADIDALCERIVVICGGRVAYSGSVGAAKASHARRTRLVCTVRRSADTPPPRTAPPGIEMVREGVRVVLTIDRARATREDALAWLGAGCEILAEAPGEVSTGDLLLDLYGAARAVAA
ncbi:ABC transporter ATP-binding protein [Salinarimonas chemoclinalis]|uniref:ABC transporter ATP-binding protein n=1 Tax=Salinarimonas chemoclinalis TaxID=3241599 RepID=UPI0035589D79